MRLASPRPRVFRVTPKSLRVLVASRSPLLHFSYARKGRGIGKIASKVTHTSSRQPASRVSLSRAEKLGPPGLTDSRSNRQLPHLVPRSLLYVPLCVPSQPLALCATLLLVGLIQHPGMVRADTTALAAANIGRLRETGERLTEAVSCESRTANENVVIVVARTVRRKDNSRAQLSRPSALIVESTLARKCSCCATVQKGRRPWLKPTFQGAP